MTTQAKHTLKQEVCDVVQQESTIFQDGKKVQVTKTKREHKSTSTETKSLLWKDAKLQRIDALNTLEQANTPTLTKNTKSIFAFYQKQIQSAIQYCDTFARMQKIKHRESWFESNAMRAYILLGFKCNDIAIKESCKYLSCLWTWEEILTMGENMAFLSYIQQATQYPFFFISADMVAAHSVGCLLMDVIPSLKKLIEKKYMELDEYRNSEYFPRFKELIFSDLTLDEEEQGPCIMEMKNEIETLLKNPDLQEEVRNRLEFELTQIPKKDAAPNPLALFQYQFRTNKLYHFDFNCSLHNFMTFQVDGPLVTAFPLHVRKAIEHHFRSLALMGPLDDEQLIDGDVKELTYKRQPTKMIEEVN